MFSYQLNHPFIRYKNKDVGSFKKIKSGNLADEFSKLFLENKNNVIDFNTNERGLLEKVVNDKEKQLRGEFISKDKTDLKNSISFLILHFGFRDLTDFLFGADALEIFRNDWDIMDEGFSLFFMLKPSLFHLKRFGYTGETGEIFESRTIYNNMKRVLESFYDFLKKGNYSSEKKNRGFCWESNCYGI